MTREDFDLITKKYGDVASWAIWEDEDDKPKSNIAKMDVLDPDKNKNLLEQIKPNIIMVGLSFSDEANFNKPYMNFHSNSHSANDFKLRYAFKDTPYWGAYMTDLIKKFPAKTSSDVIELIKNRNIVEQNILYFREEMKSLKTKNPMIIAFGNDAFDCLNKELKEEEYSKLVKVPHFSNYINKEDYRKKVLDILSQI